MRFGEAFGGLFPGARGAALATLLRTGAGLTGRQVHTLVRDEFSLWSVQQALTDLAHLGVVEVRPVGRANVYTINEAHYATPPLRKLLDPFAALKRAVSDTIAAEDLTVILFGSVARGDANADSDIDLAVLAPQGWSGRTDLEDAVRAYLGNDCDVLTFSPEEFARLAISGEEPVVRDILTDGIVLLGAIPRLDTRVA